MDLAFNSEHIIYDQRDATWSVSMVQTYFTHSDNLVVQRWVCATYLSSNTINQTGPQAYHYVQFFAGRVRYTPFGIPCDHIMVIIDQSNAFVITAYLVL